jgi:hypothetical protein
MAIIRHENYGIAGRDEVDIPVSVAGMDILVGPGTYKMLGNSGSFDTCETHTVSVNTEYSRGLRGYLVESRSDHSLALLVDELEQDGVDQWFSFPESPFVATHIFFDVLIPAGATSLESLDFHVYQLLLPPTRQTPSPPSQQG